MKPFVYAFTLGTALAVVVSMSASAQSVASLNEWFGLPFPPALAGRAGLPLPDNRSTQAEQAAKPADNKGTATIIGCLNGPDKNGKYTLRSMSQRTGVEVFGPDDLKSASGSKVKLTGSWKSSNQSTEPVSAKKNRTFQATDLEVMAATCDAPSEKTPVSKQKQQKQQQNSGGQSGPGGKTY